MFYNDYDEENAIQIAVNQAICVSQFNDGNYVICEHGGRILEYSSNYQFIRVILKGKMLSSPWSIACNSKDQIIIANTCGNNILIISRDGINFQTIQSHHSHPIVYPEGLTVDKEDNIFVCNYDISTVLKFSSSGQFLMKIAEKGEGEGKVNSPHGIFINSEGHIIIGDNGNKRIQVFDQNAQFLFAFTDSNFSGYLHLVVDIYDRIIVSCNSSKEGLLMFNCDGSFIRKIGKSSSYFNGTYCISIGRSCQLLVAEFSASRVHFIPMKKQIDQQ